MDRSLFREFLEGATSGGFTRRRHDTSSFIAVGCGGLVDRSSYLDSGGRMTKNEFMWCGGPAGEEAAGACLHDVQMMRELAAVDNSTTTIKCMACVKLSSSAKELAVVVTIVMPSRRITTVVILIRDALLPFIKYNRLENKPGIIPSAIPFNKYI